MGTMSGPGKIGHMRKSLLAAGVTSLVLVPSLASASPSATTTRLPTMPNVGRGFQALATSKTVVIWATVGPPRRSHLRVWRLAGNRWRLVGDVLRAPAVFSANVVDACPLRSTNGGRTFRRHQRTSCPTL